MKVVILSGGYGSRLGEETERVPKPMVDVGGYPLLWHIMKLYAAFGFSDFEVALGYKGDVVKSYFLNYYHANSSVTVDLSDGRIEPAGPPPEDWRVHLADTGLDTQTGGRLRRLAGRLGEGPFLMTYGDGLADIDIRELVAFHRSHGRLATVTAVRPPARFGALTLKGDEVLAFEEKPQADDGWINGGFFVLDRAVIDYVEGDDTVFERAPLEALAADRQLAAWKHDGFWLGMDTMRDVRQLRELWDGGAPPWRLWSDGDRPV